MRLAAAALGQTLGVLRSDRKDGKASLAGHLLRMRAKYLLGKAFPRLDFRTETIWGRKIECFNHYELMCMFETVFLERDYRFQPATRRPRILDCGSNIGLSILFFKREFPDSTVLGFEPDAETYSMLRRNVERNALPGIELHNLALAGTAGSRELFCDKSRPGSTAASLLPDCGLEERRSVRCALLSDFIREDVDFLKLDIEGAELEVIEDLVRTGAIQRVRQMAVEYHPVLFPHRDGYSWLWETLEQNGFDVQIRSGAPSPPGSALAPPVTLFASRPASAAHS